MPAGADGVSECFICQKQAQGPKVPGGVIYNDGVVYAGHTLPLGRPDAYLGYLMVEPARHVARLGDLTDEEAAGVGRVMNLLSRALIQVEGAEHVYGFVFGDRVPHLHAHLAPRYPGTPEEYWGAGAVGLQTWAGARRGDPSEIDAVGDRIREFLESST